jgi:hypothetical protein
MQRELRSDIQVLRTTMLSRFFDLLQSARQFRAADIG